MDLESLSPPSVTCALGRGRRSETVPRWFDAQAGCHRVTHKARKFSPNASREARLASAFVTRLALGRVSCAPGHPQHGPELSHLGAAHWNPVRCCPVQFDDGAIAFLADERDMGDG